MKRIIYLTYVLIFGVGILLGTNPVSAQDNRTKIHALYIPLADHYAGIVAYEKYRDKMKKADYTIERMPNWNELRAYFMSGEVDLAYAMAPLAMDMFKEAPIFRWVSLLHRDGSALAVNDILKADMNLAKKRVDRKPTPDAANAFVKARERSGKVVKIGVPSLLSTHSVILYRYLKENGKTLGIGFGPYKDAVIIAVPPPKAPLYIKKNSARGVGAAFEQSLPWADVVETGGFGHVVWYSKDVMPWPKGHVECIVLANDEAIKNKNEAVREVIYYIHKAGQDIEAARKTGGKAMIEISDMVRKHVPEHNEEAIAQSLRIDLNVINYKYLNIDKPGLKQIMDYAVEGGILKRAVDIEAFSDGSFSTDITEK